MNYINVLKAWRSVCKNLTSEEAKQKAEICSDCEFAKYNKYVDFIDDELKEVKGLVCTKCSCPLIAKVRSTEKCPVNKW